MLSPILNIPRLSTNSCIMEDSVTKVKVLLIDDQALVRTALAELLQAAEPIEVVASTGNIEDAVRCAAELRPDVVLLDVLSNEDSFAGACAISASCPDTKVIMMDDVPSDANARDALRINAHGYLTKLQPFSQFAAAVREVAHGQRVYAPEIARRLVQSADGLQLPISAGDNPLAGLTRREMDVVVCLAEGKSVKQCAESLGIGPSTVGNHKSRLMKKLGVHKTIELVHLVIRAGLLPQSQKLSKTNGNPSVIQDRTA
jgi:DNA-binding NarL/FixJ family response regulator